MRKSLALLAAAAMTLPALAFAPAADGGSSYSPSGNEVQNIAGSIALPTRFTGVTDGFPGLGRRAFNCAQDTNGTIAYIAPIDKASWGGPFEITDVVAAASTPDLEVDIDVYIYEELADCAFPGATPITLSEHDSGGPGEAGFVPDGARFAVIFTPSAINSTFNMRMYAPPTINIGAGDFDLTVKAGATVVWENDTSDYAWVREANGKFDSSPGTGTGIRVGDTYRRTFSLAGPVNVVTSSGTGTITVVY